MKKQNIQLANIFSIFRLICAIAIGSMFAYSLYTSGANIWTPMFYVFVAGVISDFLDGFIARKQNKVTEFGKVLDPIADKALVNTTMIIILTVVSIWRIQKLIPVLFICVTLMLLRDVAVNTARISVASQKGKEVEANIWGKIKTITQFAAIILVLVSFAFSGVQIKIQWISYAFIIATIASLCSGFVYLYKAFKK